jgi:signal peptidase II|tara:strand:+ start:638 stop:1135 length:498 start_codon:yes stop_codon:yes gene_type:complete
MNISKNIQKKIFSKEVIISIILIIFIFILDRVTKIFIINHQTNNQNIFVNDYLNFELIWNTGIGFGLLSQNANMYYHLISLLILSVIIFLIYLMIKAEYLEKILFSLILGGALGNFYDRIIYYAVPDFIDFHINDFHWFTFNIADIFITLGIILILIRDIIFKKK